MLTPGVNVFRCIQLRFDRSDDCLRDLVLDGEYLREITFVTLGPDMACGRNVIELGSDAHTSPDLAHAALEDIADAKLFADLPDVGRFTLVDERRVARDHEKPAQFGQCGDDVLTDSVRKIVLFGVAADVGEGKDRNCGTVEHDAFEWEPGRIYRWRRHFRCRVVGRSRAHFSDKSKALSRN